MTTENGVTIYLPGELARIAKEILQSEADRTKQPKRQLRGITWSIRYKNHLSLWAQGWINGQIIESSITL